jgi:hypothetical protein
MIDAGKRGWTRPCYRRNTMYEPAVGMCVGESPYKYASSIIVPRIGQWLCKVEGHGYTIEACGRNEFSIPLSACGDVTSTSLGCSLASFVDISKGAPNSMSPRKTALPVVLTPRFDNFKFRAPAINDHMIRNIEKNNRLYSSWYLSAHVCHQTPSPCASSKEGGKKIKECLPSSGQVLRCSLAN